MGHKDIRIRSDIKHILDKEKGKRNCNSFSELIEELLYEDKNGKATLLPKRNNLKKVFT